MNKDGKNKVLGVIGGMGPLATQLFYKMIIEKTEAHCDQDHLDIIIFSHATLPDRTKAIKQGKVDELFALLLEDAKALERNGANSIAIPCNTSHLLVDKLQQNINIKIIHMIRETMNKIASFHDLKDIKIGILATDGTISMKLYQNECKKFGITPIIPSKDNQKLVMKIIYDGIKNGGEIDFNDFKKIEEELLNNGCQGAILGCTELSCFKEKYNLPEYYIDAMAVLAEKSIESCDRKIKITKR
ncbi:cysteate racemase [Anaerovorax odorimutans]|uniref:aspartate/glutamate racemase family protein n=1 Tax=Anaerovorax odorimutans TaxID=109327 RepID=UPI000409A53D|nr:amino acid racemase [Anaerovorax odorimutans]